MSCVFASGPISHYMETNVYPVLVPGLEALLKEAENQDCFQVRNFTPETKCSRPVLFN